MLKLYVWYTRQWFQEGLQVKESEPTGLNSMAHYRKLNRSEVTKKEDMTSHPSSSLTKADTLILEQDEHDMLDEDSEMEQETVSLLLVSVAYLTCW